MKKMKFTPLYYILCSVPLLFAACGGRDDDQIKKDINQKLSAYESTSQTKANVTVLVKDGVVTLNGKCEGENCGDSLITGINKIKGVKEVVNKIEETAAPTDFTLRTSVQSIISKYQGVQADVVAGVVVLRGTIQRDQIQPLMNELTTINAKRIDNQLAIQ